MEHGSYRLEIDSFGQYVWSLVDTAGRRLLSGGPHKTKAKALAEIDECRVQSPSSERYWQARDKNGSAFFILRTPDGTTVGRSDAFPAEANLEQAILSIRAYGLGATLEDRT